MTQEFDFDTVIDRKGTYCTQWDYVQDRFGKAGLLPFTISDMDFASPPAIQSALKSRIEHPVFGYSRWNHDDFKVSISHWFSKRFRTTIDKDYIVYGPSVIYIISKLIERWSKVGEGVVFHSPAYDAFDKMIEGQGRVCARSTLLKVEGRYQIDWQDFECLIARPENTILLLCSPHNPTGRVWTHEELTKMAELCAKHGVRVISDEIHMDVSFGSHLPFTGFDQSMEWALVTSASKSFNVPALNGAYALIPNALTREDYLFKLKQVDGLSSPSILGVIATMEAYNHCEDWLEALNSYVYQNHIYVRESLSASFKDLEYVIPEATYLAWIDLSPLALDMDILNRTLIDDYGVAIMSGEVYGEPGLGYLRLNLGCSREKVKAGVQALIQAIQCQLKN
ncbi:MalY/PatB family protein [Vibrio barjaei]|uniref:MalY/PatB family protein n=1 Tax=Vibrio barjaei TaxID=1676683 RepID=UPI0007BBA414|nr:MalY/PatB family protein [Vibrio barjaei]OIN26730.1 transcriptional regulator [Vibrio barjaei]